MKYLRGCLAVLFFVLTAPISIAQDAQSPIPLTFDQPVSLNIDAPGDVVRLSYRAEDALAVSFQALSDRAQPTIRILQDGEVLAHQPNPRGEIIINLASYLQPGDYILEISTTQASTGRIIVAVQTETVLSPILLAPAQRIFGELTSSTLVAVYRFEGLPEVAYLDVGAESGIGVRLIEAASGQVVAVLGADLLGARLTLPPSTKAYRVEIIQYANFSSPSDSARFSLCYAPVGADECAASVPIVAPTTASDSVACTVTPFQAGGANIRQSASVDASVLIALPGGQSAEVVGITPDGTWYQVRFNGVTGFASAVAVQAEGDCEALGLVNPPAVFVPLAPTVIPASPTSVPAPPTPSGPCLITLTGPEFIYVIPDAIIDNLLDQVQGGELIPVGRWQQNPNWWKTNYNSGWWLNTPGTNGQLSGDCSQIPFINP